MKNCPCCSGKNYVNCCAVFISGEKLPETPEELMRSRYTAYTQVNSAYIAHTMKPPASDKFDIKAMEQEAKQIKWTKLEVIHTQLEHAEKGFVEFKAFYTVFNKTYILQEVSEFHKENGQWFYVDGKY